MKPHPLILGFLCLLGLGSQLHAQAIPTASRGGVLQAGGGITYANPDYGRDNISGATGWVDFDFTRHIGVEATVHFVSVITPSDIGENSYLVGPRFVLFRRERFNVYAKGLVGLGSFIYQYPNRAYVTDNYTMYALGAGVDVRATRRITVRPIDVEFQKWPGYGNGLSPLLATVGVSYEIF